MAESVRAEEPAERVVQTLPHTRGICAHRREKAHSQSCRSRLRDLENLDLRYLLDERIEHQWRDLDLRAIGSLLDGERKSTQPIAIRLAEESDDAEALRQRLQQCVSISSWSDDALFRRLALKLDSELPDVEALVVDDTGFAKKGEHSVGVARQYTGTLGRVDNSQVAVSLHLAGARGSGCIAMRLYLPDKEWASDKKRRAAVGVR